MTLKCTVNIKNGDFYEPFRYYECDRCSVEVPENFPHFQNHKENYHLCWDCGFIEGKISEKEYVKNTGICLSGVRAKVIDGKVVVWVGNKSPDEYKDRDYRRTNKYKSWRKKVFERDNYTCQHCQQVGGELNAHHIKPFAKFKELRYEVSNGLTLCVECHRQEHRSKLVAK